MAAISRKDAGSASSAREGIVPPCSHADAFQPERTVTVLLISQLPEDHLLLRGIFSHSKWQIYSASSWEEAQFFLESHPMPVVLCEAELVDCNWRDVLAGLSGRPDPPALIVTSHVADEYLWAEVLNLGGYDVLMKPFDQTEVFRVISLAWLNWKNGRERKVAAPAGLANLAVAV